MALFSCLENPIESFCKVAMRSFIPTKRKAEPHLMIRIALRSRLTIEIQGFIFVLFDTVTVPELLCQLVLCGRLTSFSSLPKRFNRVIHMLLRGRNDPL